MTFKVSSRIHHTVNPDSSGGKLIKMKVQYLIALTFLHLCSTSFAAITVRDDPVVCEGIDTTIGLLPDPDDCNGYYVCWQDQDHGSWNKVKMSCPNSMSFNSNSLSCDFNSNIVCSSKLNKSIKVLTKTAHLFFNSPENCD